MVEDGHTLEKYLNEIFKDRGEIDKEKILEMLGLGEEADMKVKNEIKL